jgi:hypothetical protein
MQIKRKKAPVIGAFLFVVSGVSDRLTPQCLLFGPADCFGLRCLRARNSAAGRYKLTRYGATNYLDGAF